MTDLTVAVAYLMALLLIASQPTKVLDGDSVVLGVWGNARIAGIDAPEIGGKAKCDDERVRADAARERLAGLLAAGMVSPSLQGFDKYGRPLVRLVAAGKDVAAVLVAEGLARPYSGGTRETWCNG